MVAWRDWTTQYWKNYIVWIEKNLASDQKDEKWFPLWKWDLLEQKRIVLYEND